MKNETQRMIRRQRILNLNRLAASHLLFNGIVALVTLVTFSNGHLCAAIYQSGSPVSTLNDDTKKNKDSVAALSVEELASVRRLEGTRVQAINQVIESVVAIYDENREGGGSGVIIHPSGIALTNHHVIMGAGVSGFGGISDGKLYHWKLIGTDPGGDVAIIQMEGRDDFPCTPLGDSDKVRVGDWALAMGNPFILTEDQAPTVTLGIVSGIKRYQSGAGQNQLVYGNCIQVDSSINPGNSGGPLFNMFGEVIGINGRGSFQDRGRVNVGLGYAISSNQIKNFIPELLATKLVEHATLDANFTQREGKIVCSTLNRDSPIAEAGLELGDELLEFEGIEVTSSNQFTNLICTLPEDWPALLKIKNKEGQTKELTVRTFGLPYSKPKKGKKKKGGDKSPEQRKQEERAEAMVALLSAEPGTVRHEDINQQYAELLLEDWQAGLRLHENKPLANPVWKIVDRLDRDGNSVGYQTSWLLTGGRFRTEWSEEDTKFTMTFDGKQFYFEANEKEPRQLTLVEAKTLLPIVATYGLAAQFQQNPFADFGKVFIDASDKSQSQPCYRLKTLDQDEDPFFVWVTYEGGANAKMTLNHHDGKEMSQHSVEHVVSKVAANRDCKKEGGVIFEDYEKFTSIESVWVAKKRHFISGLGEKIEMSLVNESVELVSNFDFRLVDSLTEKFKAETEPEDKEAPPIVGEDEAAPNSSASEPNEDGDEDPSSVEDEKSVAGKAKNKEAKMSKDEEREADKTDK